MQRSRGHVHFFSLVVFILAVIGAVQVVHWYREHTLWENALATFQEVNQQVRVLLEKAGCLEEYDRGMASFLESVRNNPKALASMQRVLEALIKSLQENHRFSEVKSGEKPGEKNG